MLRLAGQDRGGDGGAAARPLASDHRSGSVEVNADGPLEFASPPTAYRVVYLVHDWAGGTLVESTDVLTVERPYRGRLEVRGAEDESARSVTTTDFGRVSLHGADAEALLLDTPPALAVADLRLDAVLEGAADEGLVERREHREVSDLTCQVVRTREPLAAGTLGAEPPSSTDYSESCIAANGLVLEEIWVTEGRLLRRRLAIELDTDPVVEADAFGAFGRHLEPREGGGSVRPVDPTTSPAGGVFWDGLTVPQGFGLRGRYAVVPPQRSEVGEDAVLENPVTTTSKNRIGAVADVWERGIDILILEQGGSADGSKVFELEAGRPVFEVAGLGTGQVIHDGRVSELRFPLESGRYLRLLGTLPIDQLKNAASSLRAVPEGSGLVYLDGDVPDHDDDHES